MHHYFKRRLWIAIPTFLGISLVCFFLVQLTPGGPVEQVIAQWKGQGEGEAGGGRRVEVTEEQKQMLIRYYGFDKPMYVRYFTWISKVLQGDLGESYYYNRPVQELIGEALPVSFTMGAVSLLLTYFLCIPLGIWKAVKNRSVFDRVSSAVVFFLYSIPSFALGILLIVLLGGGSFWNVFPIEGLVSDSFDAMSIWEKLKDVAHHLFLPLLCYTIGSFASLTLLMKNSLLEELNKDYLTTARAKGLSERRVVLRHAVRNALIPIASGLGQWLSVFFTGSLLIESIFNLRGLGRLSYESILHRDYPIVLGVILVLSVAHILGNLLSDFLYTQLDPRIDFE